MTLPTIVGCKRAVKIAVGGRTDVLKRGSHFGNVGVGEGNSPSGNGRENLASLWRDLQFLRYRVDRRGHPDGDKGKVQPVCEVQKLV
jgi:hypothetical protein